jgi:16S rRNA (cytosine967-C5)-methyltransferase
VGLSEARGAGKAADTKAGLAVRQAATGLLFQVLERGQPLDRLLEPHGGDKAYNALPPRDRRLAHAMVATALRRHGEIEALLGSFIEKRPRKAGALYTILEIAVAQILYMEVGDHAAVSLAIDQVSADHDARHFKALANAVLRRIGRERDKIVAASDAMVNAPEWLRDRWAASYGEAATRAIAAMHLVEPALDLSVKNSAEGWAEKLGGIVLPTGSVRLIPSGPVEDLPGYGDGAWWVQDAAAALPAKLLGDVTGKLVADLCAAPGGKTAQLAQAGAIVTAVDISAIRLKRLSANLSRLGLSADVVAADILKFEPREPFDAILLDAPCSSTGTIRRHPDIPWLKKPDDVAKLAALQSRMIERAAGWLKPGGLMVYCTCSLEPEEGEAQMRLALSRKGLSIRPVTAAEVGGLRELLTPDGAVRTLPSQLPSETPRLAGLDGFFIMRLVKG